MEDLHGLDEASVSRGYAKELIESGVNDGTIRADVAANIDYDSLGTGKQAYDAFAGARETSAKIEHRSLLDGYATGEALYGSRRMAYFNDSTMFKSSADADGNIGYFSNIRSPHATETFNEAFGDNGAKLLSRLREGGALTPDEGQQLFNAQARKADFHLTNLRKDSTDGAAFSDPEHFELLRLTMQNNGRLPNHLVAAYKTGDKVALVKSLLLHKGSGKVTANDIRERQLMALEFMSPEDMKKQGLDDADALAAKVNGMEEEFKAVNDANVVLPVSGKGLSITSGFGKRKHPILKITKQHNGLDFGGMKKGDPIHSVVDGNVHNTGFDKGFGKWVMVKHKDGTYTVYAHLDKVGVKRGQKVAKGDVLGGAGTTGRSTGVHLHLEHWADAAGKKRLDPAKLFPPAMLKSLRRHRKR